MRAQELLFVLQSHLGLEMLPLRFCSHWNRRGRWRELDGLGARGERSVAQGRGWEPKGNGLKGKSTGNP